MLREMLQVFLIKRNFLAIFLVLAGLLVAACGNEDSSGDDGSAEVAVEAGSLSKSEFIERADEICRESEVAREDLISEYLESFAANPSNESERAQAETLVNSILVPAYQKLINRISALGAPAGDEDEVSAFLTSFQKSLEDGEANPLEFVRSREPFVEGVKLSDAYGFEVCLS